MNLRALAISAVLVSSTTSYIVGHHIGYKEVKTPVVVNETHDEDLMKEVMQLRRSNQELSDNILASRGKELTRRLNSDTFTITAYSPYDNVSGIEAQGDGTKTSTGTRPGPGTFAVDPTVIPYGSAIAIIYSDGTIERGYARDTGGKIKGNHIDVFRETYKQTTDFGKRHAVVMWYKEDR